MLINKLKNWSISALLLAVVAGCGGGSGGNKSSTTQPAIAEATKVIHAATAQPVPVAADYQNAVQELYVAYFGRPADATGLVNFENALLAANAPTDIQGLNAAYNTSPAIQSLMNNFGTSAESKALYGTGNTAAFVSAIYTNVLGRTPVPNDTGAAWWVNAITNGGLTQGNAALSIMAGALVNTSAQGILDGELINNRIAAASYFTTQLLSIQNAAAAYSGNTAAATARSMLNVVTAATATNAFQASVVATINSLLEFSGFVSVTASDSTSMTLAWTNAQNSTTTAAQMNYQIYVSTSPSFTPSASNLNQTVTGVSAAKISGLIPATTYYTQVVAVDKQSLASASGIANSWTTAQASGTNPLIQGRIYPSLSNYAYQEPVIPEGGIVGTITTAASSVSSDATGQFQISSSGTGNDAFPSITVNASGFQKSWTTVVEATDNGAAQLVGLYPSTTVTPRPGFVKGVFTFDSGGFRNDMYLQGLFDSTYARIQNQVGANLVAISDPVFVNAYDPVAGTVTMSTTESPGNVTNGMLTEAQYTVLVNNAHSRNLAFMLQLGVTPGAMSIGGTQTVMPSSVSAGNTAFWNAWFSAYQTVVVQYATIAKNLNIEYLSLGMNEGFMSQLPVSYWTPIVSAIRSTGYTGKLVYQAMTNPEVNGIEVFGFNQQQPQAFVNLFDAIVLDVYNIGSGKTTPLNIARDDIKSSFQWLLGQMKTYNVPIFIMLGTPSVYGGAVNPQYVEPCLVCNSIAPTLQRDFMQQADVYQALAEVINATPTGAGNVMGILSWGYAFSDDYLSWTPVSGPAFAFAFDKSANVRGKPSEAVLNWWFNKW